MLKDSSGFDNIVPVSYNKNYIKIVPRDPNTIYAYWEITTETKLNFQNTFGKSLWEQAKTIIKVRNLSSNKNFGVEIKPEDMSCYISVNQPGAMVEVEVGKMVGSEFFISFAVSNLLEMPNNSISSTSTIRFVDISTSRKLTSDASINEIYEHFGFNDVFKVLVPSSSEHTKYIEDHDFVK